MVHIERARERISWQHKLKDLKTVTLDSIDKCVLGYHKACNTNTDTDTHARECMRCCSYTAVYIDDGVNLCPSILSKMKTDLWLGEY